MRTRAIHRKPARRVALAAAGVALVVAPASQARFAPSAATDAARCASATKLDDAMLCLVNETRARRGLPPVVRSTSLGRAAELRATAIVRCRDFSHTPCGQSFASVFRAVGYAPRRSSVGENIGWGAGEHGSPHRTLRAWLRSPAHRRILLGGRWRELGVSAVSVTDVFAAGANTVWVAEFGRGR
jgi:uncharacterized protein YkwD